MGVTTKHPEYIAHEDVWLMMEQAVAGEDAVKGDRTNLPKPAGMVAAEAKAKEDGSATPTHLYDAYVSRAQYQHWVKDGLRAMMGLVSRQIPEVKLPSRLRDMEENATSDGFSLRQLFMRTVREVLVYGRQALLVDVDGKSLPFFARYTAQSAINWKSTRQQGREDLSLAVLEETRAKGDGDEFSHEVRAVYRVLDLQDGRYRVRVLDENGQPVEDEQSPGLKNSAGETVKPLDYIPIIFVGSTDNSPDVDEPPLLTMAKAALKDYQLSADYFIALHQTSHPQPWVSGLDEETDLSVTGPSAAWDLGPNGSCGYLEFQGAGIEAVRRAMLDQKNAALEAGARVMDVGGTESGEARKTRQNDQHATLHSVVITAAEAIEQALRYAADWVGANPDEVVFSVKPDFNPANIDPQVLQQLQQAVMSGGLSWDTYWLYLTSGKLPEHDYNEEALRIENPGNIVAEQEWQTETT